MKKVVERDLDLILKAVRNTAWRDGFWYGAAIGGFIGGAGVALVRLWLGP